MENLELELLDIEREIVDIFKPEEGEMVINTPAKAEWLGAKINNYYENIATLHNIYEKKLNEFDRLVAERRMKIIQERNDRIKPLEKDVQHLWARFGTQMREFMRLSLEGKRTKSLNFGGLTFGTRKIPEKITIKEEEKVWDWACENMQDSIIQKNVSLSKLKEYLESSKPSELPPGVIKEEGKEKFQICARKKEINALIGLEGADAYEQPNPDSFTAADILNESNEEIPY